MVDGYVKSEIPDYQMSAFLMAVYFRGMNDEELFALTKSMIESGEVIDLSDIKAFKVDKHSTGGVGDGTSLSLVPLVASCGFVVPMISGRGLGHTGGTLDKLESIPGFNVNLSTKEFVSQLKNVGCAIISQTEDIVPADKRIYALRDTTATVDSIPLIAASIMSKKLAEGCDGLVLDVKTGNGAFMKDYGQAKLLAQTMVNIGKKYGKKVIALITDMNQPLGKAIGNAIEIKQAIDVLKGSGPEDITELILTLATYMALLANGQINQTKFMEIKDRIQQKIYSGEALEKFRELVRAQGGNEKIIDNPDLLPQANFKFEMRSEEEGYVIYIDTERVGISSVILGGGREKITDKIDHSVGIVLHKKLNDYVNKGDIIATFYYNDPLRFQTAYNVFQKAYKFSKTPLSSPPQLVYELIQ